MNRMFGKAGTLRSLVAAGACLSLAALVGCGGGSDKASVSGKVTYKGAPVPNASITLFPATGPSYPIGVKGDGTFTVSDVPLGNVDVAIDSGGTALVSKEGYNGTVGSQSGSTAPPAHVDIPAKYKDPKTSGLKWDLKAGKNTKDFDLTD